MAVLKNLGPHLTDPSIFRGAPNAPLLAPRGVWTHQDLLIVSDTGQNRILVWKGPPQGEFAEPYVVLGQYQEGDAGRNAGGDVAANTLHYPSGVWSDGEKLIVADAWNHRVLVWHSFPEKNAQPADVVIGQPTMKSNLPNVQGIGVIPSSRSLHWPYGVFSYGHSLWIADTGNRRVLYFKEIPKNSYASADNVIGKESFDDKDYDQQHAVWPYSVKVHPERGLLVVDTQFYRALVWKDKDEAFHRPADSILGQPTFDACGQNQYGLLPSQNTLNWTYDACFYRSGILVCDTGNSRVLYFKDLPNEHNAAADSVIGKADFVTGSENSDTLFGTQNSLYWPFSLAIQENRLFIADTGNHRLVSGELVL